MSFRRKDTGLIDRSRPLTFEFDGRRLPGYHGDTLASALVASGVRLVGRSFKYHRPRGIVTAGPEEPNALVELREGARREPNSRATTVELFDGLVATSQNRWPSLAFDALGINGLLSPLFAAGFYYKTFMWPASFWEKLYEPMIRRAAGLGHAARLPDPDSYEQATAHCDVLVIGGGPAGLMAALAAGRAGARVILCDEDFRTGGRLLAESYEIDGIAGPAFAERLLDELAAMPDVRVMTRTTVFGVYDHGVYGAIERVSDHLPAPEAHVPRQRLWRIVARRSVLAAGAIERPLLFSGNDRPGVMMAGAVRSYLNRFAAIPGRVPVIYTSHDDGWRTASAFVEAGIDVAAIIDTREHVAGSLIEPHKRAGTRIELGAEIVGTRGWLKLSGIRLLRRGGDAGWVDCDLLAVSNGWNPALHLTCHLGGRPVWRAQDAMFVPGQAPAGMRVAGAANGELALSAALRSGIERGRDAAADCGFAPSEVDRPKTEDELAAGEPRWRPARPMKAFVDFQHDVTAEDVALAQREGYRSVEHLKRYTTLGMATDQGKLSSVAGLALMAELSGREIPEVGTTVFRPPYTPVAIGALAGHHRGRDFRPVRRAPTHQVAEAEGAVFVESGAWLRASYFPRSGETAWRQAVDREVLAVRSGVGVCDVSTLGKIDIQGADAAAFLDRIYTGMMSTLPVGKARYGLMLREDGFARDDGTVARLGDDHFLLSTTTANAVAVMQHLAFCHQVLWPELDVQIVSVSEQWAQLAIAGPKSRDLLADLLGSQTAIDDDALPFMGVRQVRIGPVTGRLFRISFSGERAYELAVPARFGGTVLRAIAETGRRFDIAHYGVEALGVMRIEKGHVAGNELNGRTTARDLGLERMMSRKKDFIGRAMAERPALREAARPCLAGFRPVDRTQALTAGAHLIGLGLSATLESDEGYLSSVAFSPTLAHSIALGFVRGGLARIGERCRAVDMLRGTDVEVEICHPVFVDPEGVRLHG